MVSADALLLLTESTGQNAESVVRAKLFEYMAARRPVLVVGPAGGECERIVQSCKAGVCVDYAEKELVMAVNALRDEADSAMRSLLPLHNTDRIRLEAFSRVNLTRSLAIALDRVVHSQRSTETGVTGPVPSTSHSLKDEHQGPHPILDGKLTDTAIGSSNSL